MGALARRFEAGNVFCFGLEKGLKRKGFPPKPTSINAELTR